MDLTDEVRAAFAVYRATGRLPESPDRALLPREVLGPEQWYRKLTADEARRLADAINAA